MNTGSWPDSSTEMKWHRRDCPSASSSMKLHVSVTCSRWGYTEGASCSLNGAASDAMTVHWPMQTFTHAGKDVHTATSQGHTTTWEALDLLRSSTNRNDQEGRPTPMYTGLFGASTHYQDTHDHYFYKNGFDWQNNVKGKYSSEKSEHRVYGSTVVGISILPPYFKPVLLFLPRPPLF